jgi:hypothetical protein
MDTDEVGVGCTQGGCATDAPVTIRGEGGDAASGGRSRLQSEVALWWAQKRARRGQLQSKVGQEPPETNRGVRRCTFFGSDGRRRRLASGIWQTHFTWRPGCGGLRGSSGGGHRLDSDVGYGWDQRRAAGVNRLIMMGCAQLL